MAIYFRDTPDPGAALGRGLTQGLETGLQQLLDQKLKQAQQQQLTQKAQQAGLSGPLAQLFGATEPTVQRALLERAATQTPDTLNGSSTQGLLGLTPREKEQQEKLDLKRREVLSREQKNLRNEYKEYRASVEKYGRPARQLYDAATDALEALETGKPITGVAGRFTPEFLQTDEGQRLSKLLNQIVLLRDSALPGRNSVLRLQLQQLSKPEIFQSPKELKRALTKMIKEKDFLKDLSRYEALDNLDEDFANNLPQDYEKEITKKAHEIRKQLKKDKFDVYQEGGIYEEPDGSIIIYKNGVKQPYKGPLPQGGS